MKIITISGLDGSGKSTQINLLQNYLESQGKKVFYFHAIKFGIAQKINDFRLKYCLICRWLNKCKVKKETSVVKANGFQIWLRKIFLRIDLWRFKVLLNKLSNKYDYLLSDRYFYDTLVNIAYLSKQNFPKDKFKIINPDTAIYLQINPESIMQRERKPEQGIDYLKEKKKIYDLKAKEWEMNIINGDRDKESILEEIRII